jgi:prepilin-type processing-associated H-X9-DG protein
MLAIGRYVGYGWAISLTLPPIATFLLTSGTSRRRATHAVTVGFAMVFLGMLLIPQVNVSSGGRRITCQNNMHQITQALLAYKRKEGRFPPPSIVDENGKPMHSWRVLILPYIERQDIYNAYNFNEAWDGPSNRKLHNIILDLYCCPSATNASPTDTNYVAVVGPRTIWGAAWNSKVAITGQDPAEAIVLVEVANAGIHWMEPRDLQVGTSLITINPKIGQGISSLHPQGANVAFADGSVRFLANETRPQFLDALLNREPSDEIAPDAE